ncbi:MAG TPA: hypothetical protein VGG65_01950 [Thermoanaerobaculia bacterium]
MSTRGNLGAALSAIARTVAKSLELKDVFSRIAEAVRQVLPFEATGVNVIDCPELPLAEMLSRQRVRLFGRQADADAKAQAAA